MESEENNLQSEVKNLFESDQNDRQKFSKDPLMGLEIRQRDIQRLERAKEILNNNQVSDPHDLNMLAEEELRKFGL